MKEMSWKVKFNLENECFLKVVTYHTYTDDVTLIIHCSAFDIPRECAFGSRNYTSN